MSRVNAGFVLPDVFGPELSYWSSGVCLNGSCIDWTLSQDFRRTVEALKHTEAPPRLCFISILFLFSPSLLRVKWALWGWFSSTLAHSDRRLKSGPDVVSTNIGLCLCSKFSVFKGCDSGRILFPRVSGEQYHCVKFARVCRDWWTIAAEDNKKHFHPLVLQHKLKLFWGERHTHGPFPASLG